MSETKLNSIVLLDAVRAITKRHPVTVAEKMAFLNTWCNADYVAITASGQVYEYEIKISRGDYLRDVEKPRHEIYSDRKRGKKPNRFWYVMPPGIAHDDLPSWAGLYEFKDGELTEVVKAPLMWSGKHEIRTILQCAAAMKRRGI